MPASDRPISSHRPHLEEVWLKMSPGLTTEVKDFWTSHKMLTEKASAEERAKQSVVIVRDGVGGKIVGLSTADIVVFRQLKDNKFFLFRAIVLPVFRMPGLISKLIVQTRDLLESSQIARRQGCIGMLTFVENPRIQEFRREAIWPASKMVFIGKDKQGRHIRVSYFKGALI